MASPRRSTATRPRRPADAPGSARVAAALLEQRRRIARAAATLDAPGVDAVHGARVAARRLRSMLKTFRSLLDERRARVYRTDLRRFAQSLGTAREADVRKDLLLAAVRDDASLLPADRERLAALLDDACLAARDQLRRRTAGPEWGALCRALQRQGASRSLLAVHDAELGTVVRLAARAWRRPVRLLRQRPTSTAELHELRLAFKHCRYALEPLADVAPKATERLLRRLRAAQDRIGEHRDLILAAHWVLQNERPLGRPLVARIVADLERQERVLRRQSAARAARVLTAWREWQDATRRIRSAAK